MTNSNPLVNQRLIDDATADVTTAQTRVAAASATIATAQVAADTAKAAANAAIAAGDADALDLDQASETAARRLNVATRIHAAAIDAHRVAVEGVRTQTGVAWRPVYARAAQDMLDSAKAASSARLALTAAEAAHGAARDALHAAVQKGCGDVTGGRYGTHRVVEYAAEVRIFGENYHTAYWLGLDADGRVKFTG